VTASATLSISVARPIRRSGANALAHDVFVSPRYAASPQPLAARSRHERTIGRILVDASFALRVAGRHAARRPVRQILGVGVERYAASFPAAAAVHHRCITRTPFGARLQHSRSTQNRMVKPIFGGATRSGRRIRLIGLLRKIPAFAGIFYCGLKGDASPVHHASTKCGRSLWRATAGIPLFMRNPGPARRRQCSS
jgi:hypothetical protein